MTSDVFSTQSFEGSEVELLELYLAGKLTEHAAERVERWVAAHADAWVVVEAFRDGVVEEGVEAPDGRIVVNGVRARRGESGRRLLMREQLMRPVLQGANVLGRRTLRGKAQPLRGKAQPLRGKAWYPLAGVALAVTMLVVGWHVAVSPHTGSPSVPVLTYVTGNAERANITLPDGSTASLDVASRLQVPADYLDGDHTLHLDGRALFTVRHHQGQPLTVIAGQTTTRVLGTIFLVQHYPTDSLSIVAVREGRVAVNAGARRTVVLTAARQVTAGRTMLHVGEADPASFSFATGVLTLTGGLLKDAVPELNRWYDADIRLGDSTLGTKRLTGEYAAGFLSDLKELLEGTYNVRVVRSERVLTLYRR